MKGHSFVGSNSDCGELAAEICITAHTQLTLSRCPSYLSLSLSLSLSVVLSCPTIHGDVLHESATAARRTHDTTNRSQDKITAIRNNNAEPCQSGSRSPGLSIGAPAAELTLMYRRCKRGHHAASASVTRGQPARQASVRISG